MRTRSAPDSRVEVHKVEITDIEALTGLVEGFRPDVIFHLAAIIDTVSTSDVQALYRTNVLGTAAVVEALERAGAQARLIFASSAFVYGQSAGVDPLKEDDPLLPHMPYGVSKVAAEQIVLHAARSKGADVLVTRAFAHTGPGHLGAYAVADWARQLVEAGRGNCVISCGNLEVSRDYLDVRDVAAAYLAAAERGRAGEVYNVASGHPQTMRAILEELIAVSGVRCRIEVERSRFRSNDQDTFSGDSAKLMRDTGWKPLIPLERTLSDLIAARRAEARSVALAKTGRRES